MNPPTQVRQARHTHRSMPTLIRDIEGNYETASIEFSGFDYTIS